MMKDVNIQYDGSFEGLLSVVFACFENKWNPQNIGTSIDHQHILFQHSIEVKTEGSKSNRVLGGLLKRIQKRGIDNLFKVFSSELPERELLILNYCKSIFTIGFNPVKDYRNPSVMRVSQIVKMVNREIHRMHAFVRFQKTKDDIYAATIRPDFDVLGLAAQHFRDRYQDQRWMIYDTKRDYGIYYDLEEMKTIQISSPEWVGMAQINPNILADDEKKFQQMWKQYFESTCIVERKNRKLHLRHVPYRYWRYLPEKNIQLS